MKKALKLFRSLLSKPVSLDQAIGFANPEPPPSETWEQALRQAPVFIPNTMAQSRIFPGQVVHSSVVVTGSSGWNQNWFQTSAANVNNLFGQQGAANGGQRLSNALQNADIRNSMY